MTNGTFQEALDDGGTLCVAASTWSIEYYVPGPDRRYNGRFISVPGAEVLEYIAAFQANWSELQRLKSVLPAGANFQRIGKKGMSILVGGDL